MGILFQSDRFEITDASKNIKFSTTRKMPHLLYETTGTFDIPKILDGTSYVERDDEKIILTNSNINTNDPFTIGFFKITGGPADTGNKVSTGGGSILLRVLRRRNTAEFLGSSILNIKVEQGQLKLSVSQNLDRRENVIGVSNILSIRDEDILGDDTISVSYRVYYGRFQ
jgi:hypothetical protein